MIKYYEKYKLKIVKTKSNYIEFHHLHKKSDIYYQIMLFILCIICLFLNASNIWILILLSLKILILNFCIFILFDKKDYPIFDYSIYALFLCYIKLFLVFQVIILSKIDIILLDISELFLVMLFFFLLCEPIVQYLRICTGAILGQKLDSIKTLVTTGVTLLFIFSNKYVNNVWTVLLGTGVNFIFSSDGYNSYMSEENQVEIPDKIKLDWLKIKRKSIIFLIATIFVNEYENRIEDIGLKFFQQLNLYSKYANYLLIPTKIILCIVFVFVVDCFLLSPNRRSIIKSYNQINEERINGNLKYKK